MSLFRSLPSSLEDLCVSLNGLGVEVWTALGEKMEEGELASLKKLDFSHCFLKLQSARAFLFSLPPSLEVLRVNHNPELKDLGEDEWRLVGGRLTKLREVQYNFVDGPMGGGSRRESADSQAEEALVSRLRLCFPSVPADGFVFASK
uniref:Uncharacterized protein n=1 Tax=Chromera velia CCMP2878 TaxID=1169474 RepID=A0A0G4H7W7_9ALVE|eukprot:Cvel_5832.t1-p1 / transcript=Cvel_5832.t1 / gene=Cvel_5832 / organism=Chromera_velia_CCMP2878 / gene_product=hypothetical protein / transcript_product=hypothetical protein / location=Cvel_scaffold277:34645-35082(-) / protein_length=146 / sequence_SO=supercontig / SO=protein_coding / is_pseudo=false